MTIKTEFFCEPMIICDSSLSLPSWHTQCQIQPRSHLSVGAGFPIGGCYPCKQKTNTQAKCNSMPTKYRWPGSIHSCKASERLVIDLALLRQRKASERESKIVWIFLAHGPLSKNTCIVSKKIPCRQLPNSWPLILAFFSMRFGH